LNIADVKREWIAELEAGQPLGPHCPDAYRTWVETGKYLPLESPATLPYRTTAEQTPDLSGCDTASSPGRSGDQRSTHAWSVSPAPHSSRSEQLAHRELGLNRCG
jgi:hypothetical protein